MTAAAAQEPRKDPPKDDPFPRRVTVYFLDTAGREQQYPLTGRHAKTWVGKQGGDTYWAIGGLGGRRPVKAGDVIEEEDGPGKGTRWKVVPDRSTISFKAEKLPAGFTFERLPPPKKKP